jgi:hypothetical protein
MEEEVTPAQEKKTIERRDPRGAIDRVLGKVVSRKLLVWATATYALFSGLVPSEDWIQICLLYIGSQAAVDMLSSYVKAKHHGM